jgi:hypothetical protein
MSSRCSTITAVPVLSNLRVDEMIVEVGPGVVATYVGNARPSIVRNVKNADIVSGPVLSLQAMLETSSRRKAF